MWFVDQYGWSKPTSDDDYLMVPSRVEQFFKRALCILGYLGSSPGSQSFDPFDNPLPRHGANSHVKEYEGFEVLAEGFYGRARASLRHTRSCSQTCSLMIFQALQLKLFIIITSTGELNSLAPTPPVW